MHFTATVHQVFMFSILVSASSRLSTSKSASGSEYVNIGTPEETVLETYFVMLSKFNFDRARDQCVSISRERMNNSSLEGAMELICDNLFL